ncbi:MAG TPA: plasmid pRiA4b ORF-3 family protein [Beijerinckiaceae bacterium]|nr:plasmid pRiA4b ORF-3 family protein [Beijerinckiaceae bacterium]
MVSNVESPAPESIGEIATVRVELLDTDPLIWREVEVPTSVTLKSLHEIIQALMGWEDYHLWEFTTAKQRFGPPSDEDWGNPPLVDAAKTCLRDVLKPRKTSIDYLYDFGDSWELRLIVTRIRPGEPDVVYPRYIAGERNAPPEDCGGIPGFYNKLDIIADPKNPDHDDIVEWMGEYDPETVDEKAIKARLARVANRRKIGTRRSKKPKASD